MAIIYRTTGPWGTGKGSPLTSLEGDLNLFDLDQRTTDLEANPPAAIGIANIQVVGTTMMIFLTDGTELGPFDLPIATFSLRGDYVIGAQYFQLDLVSVPQRGLFLVRLDHTTTGPFDPAATDVDGHALYLKVFGEDTYRYDVGLFYPAKVGAGIAEDAPMAAHLFTRQVQFSVEDSLTTPWRARLLTAPTDDLEIPITHNGSAITTLTFAAGETQGVFAPFTVETFEINDYMSITRPETLDATAANLMVTIQGVLVTPPADIIS